MPRSGTTWLSWLMGQHEAVVSIKQSGLFYAYEPLRKWWEREIKFFSKGASDSEGASYELKKSCDHLPAETLDGHLRTITHSIVAELCATNPRARVFFDQTPEHLPLVPHIAQVLPEARFLHLVRDPRAVVASVRKAAASWGTPGSFPTSPIQIATRWSELVALARDIEKHTPNVLHVHYEKLTADTERELARIHEWLELPSDPESRAAAIEACRIEKLRKHTEAPKGFFRRGSAEGWREDLSSSELRVVEYVARDAMAAWGYEPEHPRAGEKPLRLALYEKTKNAVRGKGRGNRLLRAPRRAVANLKRTIQIMGN